MMAPNASLITLDPPELVFEDVLLNQVYSQQAHLVNNLSIAVTLNIRPGSPERYSVSPASLTLAPGASAPLVITLKVIKFAYRKKAENVGQRDIFHIKSSYFEQKFFATFLLAPLVSSAPPPSQYGGLLSADWERPPGRQSSPNCHSREGLQVPHAHEREPPGALNGQGVETGSARGSSASFEWGDETARRPPASGISPARQGRAVESLQPPKRGRSPSLVPGHNGAASMRLSSMRGLASPPSSCSPPRNRETEMHASSPRQRPRAPTASAGAQQDSELGGQGEESIRGIQPDVLREKDEIIGALKAQLAIRESRNVGRRWENEPPSGELVARMAEVEGANDELRSRLREVTAEVGALRTERTMLVQLQESLEAATPDAAMLAEAARVRERVHAASQQEKVTAALSAKDAALGCLERDMEAASVALADMRCSVEEMGSALEASEARVVALLEERQSAREQARAERQEQLRVVEEARMARDAADQRTQLAESRQAALQAQLEEQAARLDELSHDNAALTADLQAARESAQQAGHATARISQLEAEAVASVAEPASWRRALAEAEEALSAKDELVAQMEHMLSQQMERIQALTNHVQTVPASSLTGASTKTRTSIHEPRPNTARPPPTGSEIPPEPRCARPTVPQNPGTNARQEGTRPESAGPTPESIYGTLMSRNGPLRRQSPQRPQPGPTPTAGNALSLTRGGKSGVAWMGADCEEPDGTLVARAEIVQQTARSSEARVDQLADKMQSNEPQSDAIQAQNQQALLAIEVEQLRIQVADLQRELAVTTAGVAQRERRLLDLKETAARRALAVTATHAAELGTVTRRAAEAERKATVASLEAQQLQEEVQAAKAATERARAAAESGKVAGERRAALQEATVRKLQEEALVLRRSAEQAASVADEKSAAVSVLLESVETLHGGSDAEREQRLVTLTAQLAGAQAVQAALERRAAQLQDEVRQAGQARTTLADDVDRLRTVIKQREQRLAQCAGETETLRRTVAGLRSEVRERDGAAEALVREAERLKEALRLKSDEAESRAKAAEQQQTRMHAQLQRERNEAGADLRAVREELAQAAQESIPSTVTARLQSLLTDAHGSDAVIARLSSAVIETERQLSRARVESRLNAADASRLKTAVSGLETALDWSLSEWQVAEGRLALAQARRESRQADEAGWAETRGALLRSHVETLGAQLEIAHQELAGVRGQLADALRESVQERERAARLAQKLLVAEADVAAVRDATRERGAEECEVGGNGGLDKEMQAWVEEQVVRVLLRADPQEKLLALSRELAALKLANGHLQTTLTHARRKQDAAISHAAALHHVIDQLESRLESALTENSPSGDGAMEDATSAGSPTWSVAELAARLAAKGQEVFALRDEGLALRQTVSRLEADLSEALGHHAASSAAQARQREADAAAAAAAADEVAAAHRAEVRAVQVEREAEARAHRQERAALQQEKVRVLEAAQEEAAAAVATMEEQLTEAKRQVAALQGVQQAAQRIPLLEQELQQAHTENEHVAAKLASVTAQLAALEDERELRAGVASDLERLAARLEHAGAGGSGRGSGGKAAVAGGSLAAVSKQLVQAKLAEADAQRKLRVSARAELELRQLLADREKRIDELKQGRHVPPSRSIPSAPGMEDRDGRAARQRSVVELRIEVAKKDAAVAGLQATLADATANSRRQDADLRDLFQQRDSLEAALDAAKHAERQLRRHVAWLEEDHVLTAAAISSAVVADGAGTLSRPPPKGPLTVAVQKLVQRLRDKDLALRKMRQRKAGSARTEMETEADSSAAIIEPGLPLIESQSCVIRELSARVASLLQEQSRLHARLAATRTQPPSVHVSQCPALPSEPPAIFADDVPLPRVASWPDRLSTPRHKKPSPSWGSREGSLAQLASPATGTQQVADGATAALPRPHPRSSMQPATNLVVTNPLVTDPQVTNPLIGAPAPHADVTRPTAPVRTAMMGINSFNEHPTEAERSNLELHVAAIPNERLQEARSSHENSAVTVQNAPLGDETAATQPLPAAEAATVSALCDLLLHHVEALEANKSDVSAAALGAVALRDADSINEVQTPAVTQKGSATGSVEEPQVVRAGQSDLGHGGPRTLVSDGAGLRILPEQLEATAGAMASELSAMRATLAVLAQGVGSLQGRAAADETQRESGIAVGTQTETRGWAEAAAQTVEVVRSGEIGAREARAEKSEGMSSQSLAPFEHCVLQTRPAAASRSDCLAPTDTVGRVDVATQSDFPLAIVSGVHTATGGVERRPLSAPTAVPQVMAFAAVGAHVGVANQPSAARMAAVDECGDRNIAEKEEAPTEGTARPAPVQQMAWHAGSASNEALALSNSLSRNQTLALNQPFASNQSPAFSQPLALSQPLAPNQPLASNQSLAVSQPTDSVQSLPLYQSHPSNPLLARLQQNVSEPANHHSYPATCEAGAHAIIGGDAHRVPGVTAGAWDDERVMGLTEAVVGSSQAAFSERTESQAGSGAEGVAGFGPAVNHPQAGAVLLGGPASEGFLAEGFRQGRTLQLNQDPGLRLEPPAGSCTKGVVESGPAVNVHQGYLPGGPNNLGGPAPKNSPVEGRREEGFPRAYQEPVPPPEDLPFTVAPSNRASWSGPCQWCGSIRSAIVAGVTPRPPTCDVSSMPEASAMSGGNLSGAEEISHPRGLSEFDKREMAAALNPTFVHGSTATAPGIPGRDRGGVIGSSSENYPDLVERRNAAGQDQCTATEVWEVAEPAAQTSLEVAEQSAGPGPSLEGFLERRTAVGQNKSTATEPNSVLERAAQTEEDSKPSRNPSEFDKRGKVPGQDQCTATESGSVTERAAQTSLEVVEQSAGPGPGAEGLAEVVRRSNAMGQDKGTATMVGEIKERAAQSEGDCSPPKSPPEFDQRRKAAGQDTLVELIDRATQTSLEIAEQSVGLSPNTGDARLVSLHLKAAQAAVEECEQWHRRCEALQKEAGDAAVAAQEREALLAGRLKRERCDREETTREHSKQVAAAAAAAQSTEATLQAALASERVAAQEARHALQAVSASQASAEARVAELELLSKTSSGAGARLAAGAAAMGAVQREVAVLKAVVGSERQEHRQLVDALRVALAEAKSEREGEVQRSREEHARLERELVHFQQELARLQKELEGAGVEEKRRAAVAQEREQAFARQVALLQQQIATEAAAAVEARAEQQEIARQLDKTQRLLMDARRRLAKPSGLAARKGVPTLEHLPAPPSKGDGMEQATAAAQQSRSARQQQQWARLARAHRYSQLLHSLRAKHQRRAAEAAEKVAAAEAALAAEQGRARATEVAAAREREAVVEQHIAHLQDVEAKMVAAQKRWQEELAAVRSMAAESVAQAKAAGAAALAAVRERWAAEAAVERKSWQVKVEAGHVYAREREAERDEARAALARCEEMRDTWQQEGQAAVARLQAEHRRYRALKERAVQALEARLHEFAPVSTPPVASVPRPGSPPTHDWEPEPGESLSPGRWIRQVEATADAVRSVAESEGLRAMAGELQYARQEKQELQARNEQMRAQLAAASAELVALKRSSVREITALQARLRAAQKQAVEHSPEAWQQQAAALSTCQVELKAARAEAARKGRLLSGLEGDAKQRAAAVAAEAEARASLEAELGKARLAAARQAALVKELHRKLEAAASVDRDTSGDRQRLAAAEEKVRSLGAALARKEAALKEARAHAEAGAKDAAAAATAGAAQEKEGLQAAVKKWQGEAGRREASLRACQRQLELARQERAAALAATAEQVGAVQRLLDAAREEVNWERAVAGEVGSLAAGLAKMGVRAVRALQAAQAVMENRGTEVTSEGSEEWRDETGEAAAAAELVQLRLDEVRHVMGRGRAAAVRVSREDPLDGLVADVVRSGFGEKGQGRKDRVRAGTAALHKALAMLDQEVRWGEAAAASA